MLVPRSILLRVFLALLLVFAQHEALRHGLTHDFQRIHAPSKDTTGTEEAFCAKCLAIAHLDHADGVASVIVIAASFSSTTDEPVSRASATLAFAGPYQSRAPPVVS